MKFTEEKLEHTVIELHEAGGTNILQVSKSINRCPMFYYVMT